jgi:hypothetical protein
MTNYNSLQLKKMPTDPEELKLYKKMYHKSWERKQKGLRIQNTKDQIIDQLQKMNSSQFESMKRTHQLKLNSMLVMLKELNGESDVAAQSPQNDDASQSHDG